jgi:CoA:oxalate CoA-transferase
MAGPLKGIRVIDLSWVLSGPFATMVLADLGADVIKVERPGTGDLARRNGPFIDSLSSYFMSINRGKRSITLDLSKPRGKEILLALVERADILVENFVPGTMKRLGLDYEVLKEHNPRLIYASISGFGQTGPYAQRPALDVIVQGMAGTLSITGEPDGPPVRVGTSIGDITASLFAVIGILAALQERQVSGRGQALDISMLDSQVAILENAIARYFATGQVPRRLGTRHPVTTPFQAFRTRDGYIVVAVMDDQWPLFCKAIGRVDLLEDERFKSGYSRTQHYHLLEPIFNEAMLKKTSQEWLEELSALGIPCGPVNSIDRVVEDPQVVHRGMIKEVPHKRLGRVKVVNSPIKLSRTPPEVERPAPDLGEHTEEVLKELLGMGDEELSALRAEGII